MDLICAQCLDNNKGLTNYINKYGEFGECSYCQNNTKVQNVDDILQLIEESVYYEWDQPENGLGRIDGDWVGEVKDSYDLVNDVLELGGSEIFEKIVDHLLDQAWYRKDTYGPTDSEIMFFTWEGFCNHVKYKSRFFFQKELTKSELAYYPSKANKVLKFLKDEILKIEMFSTISIKTKIYRARACKSDDNFSTESDLGVPPNGKITNSNRFSPSGIQMFYGSDDQETCIHEIGKPRNAIIGVWETICQLNVIDFTEVFNFVDGTHYAKDFPDILDPDRRSQRVSFSYLRELADDFSAPIINDGREHIEYVPTQVVSEYFKKKLKLFNDKKPIDGIRFYSSKTGGINYALYFTPKNCIKGHKQKVNLIKTIKYKQPI